MPVSIYATTPLINAVTSPSRCLMVNLLRRIVPRAVPWAQRLVGVYRRRAYEHQIGRFLRERTGVTDRLPSGVVYEATMRCNLHCGFCWVGDLLNLEGAWRDELPLETLETAFPDQEGLQINLTGGEIFMRKNIFEVFEVFRRRYCQVNSPPSTMPG